MKRIILAVAAILFPSFAGAEEFVWINGDWVKAEPVAAKSDPVKSVVYISTDLGPGRSGNGTGTVIASENGRSLILTNAHVVRGSRATKVTYWSEGKPWISSVTLLGSNDDDDVALLELREVLPAVDLAELVPDTGAKVHLFGFGGTSSVVYPVRKDGLVTVPEHNFVHPTTTHSAVLVQGDSGSALFDESGKLVAVNHGVLETTRTALATRLDAVQAFTFSVLRSERVLFPRLHDRLEASKAVKAALYAPEPKNVPKAVQEPQKPKSEAPAQAPIQLYVPSCANGQCSGTTVRGIFWRR